MNSTYILEPNTTIKHNQSITRDREEVREEIMQTQYVKKIIKKTTELIKSFIDSQNRIAAGPSYICKKCNQTIGSCMCDFEWKA